MRRWVLIVLAGIILIAGLGGIMFTHFRRQQPVRETTTGGIIVLPEPDRESKTSLEKALQDRRSIRSYTNQALALAEVGQLLWAAQGVNRPGGYRTAPSAGALYPLEIYLLAGQVEDLAAGLFHYLPENHALEHVWSGDRQVRLSEAALSQDSIARAPAVIVIAAIYQRTKGKYGQRGERYVHMEAGSAAQNIYLQAVSLELGTVFIGAFYDEQVQNVLGLSKDEIPLCLMPVGHPDE